MYASGIGKALLAAMSFGALDSVLDKMRFEAFTQRTHTSLASLSRDLEIIRNRGWSFDEEERYDGMSCTGAAIFNEQGIPCAGVSVSGPTARIHKENSAEFGEMVLAAAKDITLAIGGDVESSAKAV